MKMFDFSAALSRMKEGTPMKRLAWVATPIHRRKVKVVIKDDSVVTHYINYYSDRGVFSMDDILAVDWLEAE